jgi:chemotaxis protein MotB
MLSTKRLCVPQPSPYSLRQFASARFTEESSMLLRSQFSVFAGLTMVFMTTTGCTMAPPRFALQQSQMRAQQLYQANKALAMERDGLGATVSQLAADKAAMEQQYLAAKSGLDAAQARLDNLASSNSQLEERMRMMLTSNKPGSNPLSADSNRRLQELRNKYPDFDFDPQTGVSKFSTDLLFASGSDELQPKAKEVLSEFAKIMNQGDARGLKILVSGHTDDRPIKHKSTANKHHDNMGLSAHRALAVERELKHAGLEENRIGGSFYGPHQPVEPNASEQSRKKNRRVEIFVLAPDNPVAFDPADVK